MFNRRLLLALLFFSALSVGCKKESLPQQCQKLKDEIAANNIESVKRIITQFIDRLPSNNHTRQNLEALATSLSGQCGITAEVLCFGCIETLPEQSEIRLSFLVSGSSINRIIDISSSQDNKMKMLNMHE